MLLNKQNHGKQKAQQRGQSRNKGGNHAFGADPEEKQKMSVRCTVRVGPFVKSL